MFRYVGLGLIMLSLAGLGFVRPARADSAYFGWGFQCTDCTQKLGDDGLRMEFTSPPEIIGIDADGPAARAGFRAGDVLLTVDGESLTKKTGADRLFTARPGKTLRIGFRRGGLRKETALLVGSQAEPKELGSTSGRSGALLGPATQAGPAKDAPIRFSGNLDQFTIEVRGSPNVHVVMPADESWMDIISGDIRVKIRRTPSE